MPELGRFYSVASVRPVGGGYSVRLNELAPDCRRGGVCTCGKCGWDSGRFRRIYRPSPEKIAALTALLEAPELVDVPNASSSEWDMKVARSRTAARRASGVAWSGLGAIPDRRPSARAR